MTNCLPLDIALARYNALPSPIAATQRQPPETVVVVHTLLHDAPEQLPRHERAHSSLAHLERSRYKSHVQENLPERALFW